MTIKPIVIFLFILTTQIASGQVLISLLFGDKLNSDKIEFGLEGGLVSSTISNLDGAGHKSGFDIGFYFDFKFQENLAIHTGVIVKSPMGAEDLPPYPTGNLELDALMENSSVTRELRYFHLPVLLKYKFYNNLFVEGGFQIGLLTKAFDEFTATVESDDDLRYENSIRDDITKLDFGFAAGVGYRLGKGHGMNLGIRYFGGLIDINKNSVGVQKNQAIYLYVGIPIGVGKSNAEETGTSE